MGQKIINQESENLIQLTKYYIENNLVTNENVRELLTIIINICEKDFEIIILLLSKLSWKPEIVNFTRQTINSKLYGIDEKEKSINWRIMCVMRVNYLKNIAVYLGDKPDINMDDCFWMNKGYIRKKLPMNRTKQWMNTCQYYFYVNRNAKIIQKMIKCAEKHF